MQTHYDVLGVSWKANDDEIKAAFRRSVKTCHPDLHAGDRNAERQLREVLAAYEILRRPQRRVIYDRLLRAERSARVQRFVLTAFTGLICCSVIGGLTLWLPRLPNASTLVAAVAAPPETVRVAVASRSTVDRDAPPLSCGRRSTAAARAIGLRAPRSGRPLPSDSQPAQRVADNQRTAEQARPPARRAEPRLAREWGQVRESDDPMAIAAFAARHPEASESKIARSKLIGLIDSADDVALLNILGLGTGDIAERAQQRLSRLHETANAREDAAAQAAADALKERAASFVSARVTGWSSARASILRATPAPMRTKSSTTATARPSRRSSVRSVACWSSGQSAATRCDRIRSTSAASPTCARSAASWIGRRATPRAPCRSAARRASSSRWPSHAAPSGSLARAARS